MHQFINYYESRRKLIENRIEHLLFNISSNSLLKQVDLYEMLSYSLKGGKKLRGVLTLLVCETLGGDVEKALDAAVAVELIHNASLIHDDIIDGDEIRRNKLSFWRKYGISIAIIIGHYLISLGLMLFRKYGWKAVEIFNKAWINVVKGGIADIIEGRSFNEQIYRVVAKLKTGEFFAVAAVMGAIAAGKTEYEELAYRYGSLLGLTFQIADDIVDLARIIGEQGDPKFSPSIPAFIAWVLGSRKIREIAKLTFFQKKNLAKIVIEEKVIEKAIEKLCDNIRKAISIASKFPYSPLKGYLVEYPKVAVIKMLNEAKEYINEHIKLKILSCL